MPDHSGGAPGGTSGEDYARRLQATQGVWWKRALPVQAPYRWNLRRQRLGRTLDIGCGVGRNLEALDAGSVGIDPNAHVVAMARERGLPALTTEEWEASELGVPESFDGLLLAHVVEHLSPEDAEAMLRDHLRYLRPGGRVFLVCPQERGYASDATHVRFATGDDLVTLAEAVGLEPGAWRSFPFPRWAGKAFVYNEFCLLALKPR